MKRVLFDSDVLLDILAQRQPFVVTSAQALNKVIQNQVEGYVSAHAVTNIYYILRRQVGNEVARQLLARLLQHIKVASVTNQVIKMAINSPMTDFEDAVTSAAAQTADLELIVTRNTADFVASLVPVMCPDEFLTIVFE